MWQTFEIGCAYIPGSIQAISEGRTYPVDEASPTSGILRVNVPGDFAGDLTVNFQRTLLQAAGPRPDKVIGVADGCIYCGSRSDLQDEHVIPYALEGEFVIKRASCPTCAAITSKFEERVLRRDLSPVRAAMNLRTRHPKRRPKTFPMSVTKDGQRVEHTVSIEEHPTHLVLPVFDLPAVLRGDNQPNLRVQDGWIRLVGRTTLPELRTQLGGAEPSIEASMDVYSFARMIGKIAHGFAATVGAGVVDDVDVECLLPSALLAEDESIGQWVGGAPDVSIPEEGLHNVIVHSVNDHLHVRVRLFAQFGGPEYLVIAGRLSKPASGVGPVVTIRGADE